MSPILHGQDHDKDRASQPVTQCNVSEPRGRTTIYQYFTVKPGNRSKSRRLRGRPALASHPRAGGVFSRSSRWGVSHGRLDGRVKTDGTDCDIRQLRRGPARPGVDGCVGRWTETGDSGHLLSISEGCLLLGVVFVCKTCRAIQRSILPVPPIHVGAKLNWSSGADNEWQPGKPVGRDRH